MSTILVGVDASERSLDAIAFAQQLASASGASILLANVFPYDDAPSRGSNLEFRAALEAEAEALVTRLAADVGDLGPERVRTAVRARVSPAHGLHELAEEHDADVVVVGSSHVGVLGRVMPGSTGERLLHGATRAVVVVPRGHRAAARAPRHVGVAYDGSPEAEAALRAAVDAARATDGDVRVIKVMDALPYSSPALMGGPSYITVRRDLEERLREALERAVAALPDDVTAEAVFVAGDPAHELAVQSGGLDLLLAGSRGYGPLRAVLAGGVTGRLLRLAACPVAILPRGVERPLGDLFAHREARA